MTSRPSFAEIVAALKDRPELVVDRYCDLAGSWREGPSLWCLAPHRPDRRPGSFVVHLDGSRCGHWHDFARAQGGDMLDLIEAVEGRGRWAAIQTAKILLGLEDETPEQRQARIADQERRQRERRQREREAEADRARKRTRAKALWLSGQERVRGTPVEAYLAGRGIDLAHLGRQPRAIRYHPECWCRQIDEETGEVHADGPLPAMLTAIVDARGEIVGCHRTWLAEGAGGWAKAAVPKPKKVLGDMKNCVIRLWTGWQDGRKAPPLHEAPPGSRVYLTEGIEDGLSVAMLAPEVRVLVAVSLDNLARVPLPDCIGEVVICADNDGKPEAAKALERAVEAHARAGRAVRIWRSPAGKDVNDALRAADAAPGARQGAA